MLHLLLDLLLVSNLIDLTLYHFEFKGTDVSFELGLGNECSLLDLLNGDFEISLGELTNLDLGFEDLFNTFGLFNCDLFLWFLLLFQFLELDGEVLGGDHTSLDFLLKLLDLGLELLFGDNLPFLQDTGVLCPLALGDEALSELSIQKSDFVMVVSLGDSLVDHDTECFHLLDYNILLELLELDDLMLALLSFGLDLLSNDVHSSTTSTLACRFETNLLELIDGLLSDFFLDNSEDLLLTHLLHLIHTNSHNNLSLDSSLLLLRDELPGY